MLPEVREYLEDVRSHLHLDAATERHILSELHCYFEEKVTELQDQGVPQEDVARESIKSFGRPRVLARLMYEAYSKGSLTEAILSSLPHLIVAGLFISHLWRHPLIAPIAFASIVCVTLYGWWHGKPNWLYSWVGYSLLPLLIGGYVSRPALEQIASFLLRRNDTLPSIWILLLIGALFSFSLWVIIRTTIRVVRRDWVLASLMLVPLPILASWLFNIEQLGSLFQSSNVTLYQWDTLMASVLTLLAAVSVIFIRLRKRILKAGALIALGVIAGTVAGHTLWGYPGFLGLLIGAALILLFLLGPALLEAKIGHGELKGETWWSAEWVKRPSTVK